MRPVCGNDCRKLRPNLAFMPKLSLSLSLSLFFFFFFFLYISITHRHFKLEEYIKFNTVVTSVKQAKDFETSGQWQVTTRTGESVEARETTEIYDGVFVCSGMYKKPLIPEYPGLDEFEGEIVHTNEYRKAEPFAGKTVMVMVTCQISGGMG